MPAAQREHGREVPEVARYVPAAQSVHVRELAAAEKVPEAQAVQTPERKYRPAVQGMQALIKVVPTVDVADPEGQELHTVAPVDVWYVLMGHELHDRALAAEYIPAAQIAHDAPKLPAAQPVQIVAPVVVAAAQPVQVVEPEFA